MATLLSSYYGVKEDAFKKAGVFDAVVGIDTNLFLDPFLLKKTRIKEFKKSRNKIEKYYENVIRLLLASRIKGDRAWKEALKKLTFKELQGVSIGYSVHGGDGSAIGSGLAARLVDSASEILKMGIRDPEIFELVGLFEDDFGADRLSDMAIVIIKDDLYEFTERIARSLKIKDLITIPSEGKTFYLPKHPRGNKPIILLPTELLRDLPVALSWEGIGHVVATNQLLRNRLNALIGGSLKKKMKKKELKDLIFSKKENIESLIETYKTSKATSYDFANDPAGEVVWYKIGKDFAGQTPVQLNLAEKSIDQLKTVVEKIISQFKKNIEVNGLKEHLYVKNGFKVKRRHERFSQRLFYAIADSYCAANNLDINREPDAGSGPVDFKFSHGYKGRVLVEIKLSSNSALIKGFEKQLPAYQESESSTRSFFVVLRVTKSESQIKHLLKIKDAALKAGQQIPEVVIIDADLKPSASKRK